MAAQKPEADGFLAVIERKIAALKTLAESYRAALSLGALGQPGEIDLGSIGTGRADEPVDLPRGALLGKSLPAAVKLWLTAVRRKQTVREIANALREGGVESTSPNFENVVTGALHRLRATGEALRFKDGWALAELYPASLRSSLTKDSKAAKGAKSPKPPKSVLKKKNTKRKAHAKPVKSEGKKKVKKVDAILASLPFKADEAVAPNDVRDALAAGGTVCTPDYVRISLRRLVARGKAGKRDGKYFRVAT
jgi:hypothetical protein